MKANHKKPPATMPALPLDVIVDILCRLPVKTLLRFRCLSKQFRSIIDDPDFIKRHLQCQSLDHRLIVKSYGWYSNRSDGWYSKLLFLDLDSVDNAFKLELPFENWGDRFVMIGSCDGLLALRNTSDGSIGLWNISTKKHQILPKRLSDFDKLFNAYHGFFRDTATDDYKLVRIANYFRNNVTEVSVYSLKANCWRRIDGFPPYFRYCLLGEAALVEGHLNWLVYLVDGSKDLIVSFDLKNEIFFEVSLPDIVWVIEESALKVMVLGGCLCLVYDNQPVYDIWVMKEYGLKDSWTKLYSISYDDSIWIPQSPGALVYSKHGEKILIFQTCGGKVFWFDLEERKFEIVKINELLTYVTNVSTYVESLVSPKVNN